jgi:cyanate lyase
VVTKKDAEVAVRAAKARLGLTWAQLAEAVGQPVAWTTSALLGQQPMTAAQAQAVGSLLELDEQVVQALQLQPNPRGPGRTGTHGSDDLPVLRGVAGLRPNDEGTHPRTVR